jgi:hypothetical protein
LVASDHRLTFRSRVAGTESGVRTVEVFNPGPAAVSIWVHIVGAAFVSGGPASTCDKLRALPAGEQCAVAVRFVPPSPGSSAGRAEVVDSTGSVVAKVRLSGSAYPTRQPQLPGGALTIDPSLVRFGRQVVGTRSGPAVVRVFNPLDWPVTFTGTVLGGANPGNFRIGRDTCRGQLNRDRSCWVRIRFTPRFVAARTAQLIVTARGGTVPLATLRGRGASSLRSRRNGPLTLAAVDQRCFYAPASPGVWPVAPIQRPHAVRGGFNDPRGSKMVHFGVDVSAHDRAAGLAVRVGTIAGITSVGIPFDEHFELLSSDGVSRYFYYHVHPALGDGARVITGQFTGRIEPGWKHVHLSEIVAGCGLVDPRRPTGILRDASDTEAPFIGPLHAYRATPAAYRPFHLNRRPGPDPASAVSLDDLRGIVDMRARVWDLPRHATSQWPQQPVMVAGVRTYLAPVGKPGRHYGTAVTAFDGSRLIDATRIYRVYAHGTYRINACFTSRRPCTTVVRLHVGGSGFDTRRYPNGNYSYCISAVTIENHIARSCTHVTIRN